MSTLNVVALISGGKDSLFSILHCQANGHNVVAIANLHPPHQHGTAAVEDLESYMYQTIGHSVIPLYEQALGLPLYRQEILGGAVNQNKNYGVTSGQDETESLLPLLRKVLAAHPEVNAVSTGAILSDYQRTRVESVALRLGLTPLSYLWQWPSLPPHTPSSLLEDMAAVGQDSRIIKVASGGLDDSFLWHNVADRRTMTRLTKATERFGSPGDGAVLGEGGEYETLAVSGPSRLWKGDIIVPTQGVRAVAGDAGSASVQISQSSVRMRSEDVSSAPEVRKPAVFEDRFQAILEALVSPHSDPSDGFPEPTTTSSSFELRNELGGLVLLSNLTGTGDTAAEQTRSIMDSIMAQLALKGHGPDNISYTVITLRHMKDFAAVNAVYGSYFVNPNPPARATIACASILPSETLLSISITSSLASREGLHVQSRSYWAPANIGPYSQAIKFAETATSEVLRGSVFIAGQIPLIPGTMELPVPSGPSRAGGFEEQTTLALQHLDRIGRVMKVRRYIFGIALIACADQITSGLMTKASTVRCAWKLFHKPPSSRNEPDNEDEDENFDVWHQKFGSSKEPWLAHNFDEVQDITDSATKVPPLVVIYVDKLPRGADVEWIGYGKTLADDDISIPVHLKCLLDAFRDRIVPHPELVQNES